MEIKTYAPVIIPTLCRYDHFKRCLESLENCSGAEYTDVYIGLDYPANESHEVGWKQIDDYLKEKEKCNRFKSLKVIRRESNCGIGHPRSNGSLLREEVMLHYDRFILTEDDNEFSPAFLQYINKALTKYEDNERVIDICGYAPVEYDGDENAYFAHYGNAWGHGVWNKKWEKMMDLINLEAYKLVLSDTRKSLSLFFKRPFLLNIILSNVINNQLHGDGAMLIYCELYDKLSLFPSKSLVRNWGNDGSGVHSKITDKYDRSINRVAHFDLDKVKEEEPKEVREKLNRLLSRHWYGSIAILLRYLTWRIARKDFFQFIKKLGFVYKG